MVKAYTFPLSVDTNKACFWGNIFIVKQKIPGQVRGWDSMDSHQPFYIYGGVYLKHIYMGVYLKQTYMGIYLKHIYMGAYLIFFTGRTREKNLSCGELSNYYTSVMWRFSNVSPIIMWRQLRFLHIPDVEKFETSAHL